MLFITKVLTTLIEFLETDKAINLNDILYDIVIIDL